MDHSVLAWTFLLLAFLGFVVYWRREVSADVKLPWGLGSLSFTAKGDRPRKRKPPRNDDDDSPQD